MGIESKYNIKDAGTVQALNEIMKTAEQGQKGNFEIVNKGLSKSDAGSLQEGKRYIDTANKRTVVKIGNKLYYSDLTEL